jgi:Na+/H+ antiporter NhaD/arsenite permease-like protein
MPPVTQNVTGCTSVRSDTGWDVGGPADPERGCLVLAMASTLAGDLTPLGSVANLIVAEIARRHGERLSFGEYLKGGVPITLVTLALGTAWLAVAP